MPNQSTAMQKINITADELQEEYIDPSLAFIEYELAQIAKRQKENFGYSSVPSAPSPDEREDLKDAKRERDIKGQEAYNAVQFKKNERTTIGKLNEANAKLANGRNIARDTLYLAENGHLLNPFTYMAKCAAPAAKILLIFDDWHDGADKRERTKMDAELQKRANNWRNQARKEVENKRKINPLNEKVKGYDRYELLRVANANRQDRLLEDRRQLERFIAQQAATAAQKGVRTHTVAVKRPITKDELTKMQNANTTDKGRKFYARKYSFQNRRILKAFLSTNEWEKGIISIQQPSMVPTVKGRILPSGRQNDQSLKL